MLPRPQGTIALLFTDIEGSTRMWELHAGEMSIALKRHDQLLREAVFEHGGYVFKTIGDAFCVAFQRTSDALAAALMIQRSLVREPWPPETVVRVRAAIHAGAVESRDDDYFGPPLNRIARLLATAAGGQVVLSAAAHELCRDELPAGSSLRNLGAHRLRDLGRPEDVYQLIHPAIPADFPPLKSLDNPNHPNNLPQQPTSFVGRQDEMAGLVQALESERLVTIVGAGGVGKTRLALQSAAQVLDDFPDGVWFADLAPVADGPSVVQTVKTVMQIRDSADRSGIDALVQGMANRRALLIIDNCEHLIADVAKVAQALINDCPTVKLLCTSREPLRIGGEIVRRLSSLSVPVTGALVAAATLAQYDAVALFIDRARSIHPDFAITDANAPAVAGICERLDGIALAIELAAARVRSMTADQIYERLDQVFRLLTGGSRTALPRQQTLRSLIDWSYTILEPSEQLLLQRLAVFAGGWTLESASEVCVDDRLDAWEILDLLTSLVDKSLVQFDASTRERYRLLEPIRQFGREKLEESSDLDGQLNRHADWVLAYVTVHSDGLKRNNPTRALQLLVQEHDNILAALAWTTTEKGDRQTGAALCDAMASVWVRRRMEQEGIRICERAQENQSGNQNLLLALAANGLRRATTSPVQKDVLEGILEHALSQNEVLLEARVRIMLAIAVRADLTQARPVYEVAIDAADRAGEPYYSAWARHDLGYLLVSRGEIEEGCRALEAALEIAVKHDLLLICASCRANLNAVKLDMKDFEGAKNDMLENLRNIQAMGDRRLECTVRRDLGSVLLELGDHESARSHFQASLAIASGAMDARICSYILAFLGFLNVSADNLEQGLLLVGAFLALQADLTEGEKSHDDKYADEVAARATSLARQKLEESKLTELLAAGRALSLREAVQLALATR